MKCRPRASERERQRLRVRPRLDVRLRLDVLLRRHARLLLRRARLLLLLERSWRRLRELRLRISFSWSRGSFRVAESIRNQYYRKPPAMTSISPVIHFESSEAKNTAAGAMSSVSPTRPSGVCDSNIFRMSPSV